MHGHWYRLQHSLKKNLAVVPSQWLNFPFSIFSHTFILLSSLVQYSASEPHIVTPWSPILHRIAPVFISTAIRVIWIQYAFQLSTSRRLLNIEMATLSQSRPLNDNERGGSVLCCRPAVHIWCRQYSKVKCGALQSLSSSDITVSISKQTHTCWKGLSFGTCWNEIVSESEWNTTSWRANLQCISFTVQKRYIFVFCKVHYHDALQGMVSGLVLLSPYCYGLHTIKAFLFLLKCILKSYRTWFKASPTYKPSLGVP